ncbi:GGDEF domain-containing phosphodiesterase [Colwellia asteriadis]|uniref:EAL domain-containing protein n=1 Tax=Colwellia asteriadis TaxID=517723 RepID=UPI0031DC9E6B
MSRFNIRVVFLLSIIVVTSGLSFLFVQLYRDGLSLTPTSIFVYLSVLLFSSYICWWLSLKLFNSVKGGSKTEIITKKTTEISSLDTVTNLPTAQSALQVFEQAITQNKNKPLAAIVLKPINFEQANTLLGHHNSDLLLLQLAYCLQLSVANNEALLSFSSVGEPVRIARLQGLNFLVVINLAGNKYDDKSVINEICVQLTKSVPEAMSFKSFSLNFELAFGVALHQKNGNTAHEVVAHAGDALLDASSSQQNIRYFNNEKLRHTQHQLARMEQLRSDVLDEKLHWYIQPQVNIDDNSILGFQLRVHWYELQSTTPLELEDFTLLAKHSGEMYILAKQMLKYAFLTLAVLQKNNHKQPISISLPSNCLFQPDLVDYIELQIKHYNISGRYLIVELNENVLLEDIDRARSIINQLKSLDITIAITDFSGSYQALRYIRKMAIHQIKINCQQLTNDSENRVDKAITHALITLTRTMKLPLIGTDIDKRDAADAFSTMGGKYVQGNIISPGIALDEVELWLEKWYKNH